RPGTAITHKRAYHHKLLFVLSGLFFGAFEQFLQFGAARAPGARPTARAFGRASARSLACAGGACSCAAALALLRAAAFAAQLLDLRLQRFQFGFELGDVAPGCGSPAACADPRFELLLQRL